MQVFYLRKVHYYCYFSAERYRDERTLAAKCGAVFLREPLSETGIDESIPDWSHKVSSLVEMQLQEEEKRLKSREAEVVEEKIKKETEALISRKLVEISPGTWPCYKCDKVIMQC